MHEKIYNDLAYWCRVQQKLEERSEYGLSMLEIHTLEKARLQVKRLEIILRYLPAEF